MKETNSKILSQNELENARLDIMLNVLNSVSETNEVLEKVWLIVLVIQ